MMTLVVALRGVAAVAVLVVLVGGLPRVVQAGLAVGFGLWSAVIAGAPAAGAGDPTPGLVAVRELVIGATIGVLAALPLLAVATAGRIVDVVGGLSGGARRGGPYAALFSLLGAAVFVGIDGHASVVAAIATSFRDTPPLALAQPRVLAVLGGLVPSAAQLAIPWLVTAAVVEIAAGVAVRLAGRAVGRGPIAAATPAALVMMTASFVGTLAVAIAALIR
jgi:flagellar biosynthesis protein FliR